MAWSQTLSSPNVQTNSVAVSPAAPREQTQEPWLARGEGWSAWSGATGEFPQLCPTTASQLQPLIKPGRRLWKSPELLSRAGADGKRPRPGSWLASIGKWKERTAAATPATPATPGHTRHARPTCHMGRANHSNREAPGPAGAESPHTPPLRPQGNRVRWVAFVAWRLSPDHFQILAAGNKQHPLFPSLWVWGGAGGMGRACWVVRAQVFREVAVTGSVDAAVGRQPQGLRPGRQAAPARGIWETAVRAPGRGHGSVPTRARSDNRARCGRGPASGVTPHPDAGWSSHGWGARRGPGPATHGDVRP